jgi:hypothetical protein
MLVRHASKAKAVRPVAPVAGLLESVSEKELRDWVTPPGLPVKAPTTGNFLGVLANAKSGRHMNGVLQNAKCYLPEFPTLGLHVLLGFEKHLPVLRRSDHAPFWQAGIPSVMWTDTSEFRNPHYHLDTDTPDTLNYPFLRRVTQLLVATAMTS